MPIYEYACDSCGVRFERIQRMDEPALTKCPECGGHLHRVFQPVGIIFKGSGFYVTDNRAKSSISTAGTKAGTKKEVGSGSESDGGSSDGDK